MARQKRKLKYLPSNITENNRVHFDSNDGLYADEHYGYYLMCNIPKSSVIKNPRRYIYFKYKEEYYNEMNRTYNLNYKLKPIHGRSCILDDRMHHKNLIIETISLIFENSKPVKLTESLLIAIGIIIDILESNNIILKSIKDFKTEYQILIYDYMNKNLSYKNQDRRDVTRFFAELNLLMENFELILPNKVGFNMKSKNLKELSSSIMYQLEYHSLNELKSIKNKVEEYNSFLEDKEVFSLENLLSTLFKWKELKLSSQRIYPNILIHKILIDYGINAKLILKSRPRKNDLIEIEKLKKLSENGINLLNNEKYAVIWTKELFPYYPESMELNNKYNDVTKTLYARKSILTEFNITMEEIERFLYPTRETIYPLYLFLLIRTGLNSETLLDWKVEKQNSEYQFKSDDLGMITIVEGEKRRSNSSISCVMKNDSEEMRLINFYIKWCKNIYEFSKQNELFQYFDRLSSGGTKTQILHNRIFGYMKSSPYSFFKKYEIFNEKNERIDFIDHRLIRKSHNFQEYLKGKQEFERQISKKHIDSKTTKNHYEDNSIEWNESKKHKIAKSQNFLVSIFKGDITRKEHSLIKLFNGSMANCKNNKNPTFSNAPNLKENEYCIDWTKCLTSCEQANVIPKIHGPVIYAWIDFMEKQKDEFINEDHWSKEYLYDYKAAIDTIKYFTKDEQKLCEKEKHKHFEFVRMILKRTVKVGKTKSA